MSCKTLAELHHVLLPTNVAMRERTLEHLTQFTALKGLTLRLPGWLAAAVVLPRLPASLERLTLVEDQGYELEPFRCNLHLYLAIWQFCSCACLAGR